MYRIKTNEHYILDGAPISTLEKGIEIAKAFFCWEGEPKVEETERGFRISIEGEYLELEADPRVN